MEQVIHKKPQLLLKGPLYIPRRIRQGFDRAVG